MASINIPATYVLHGCPQQEIQQTTTWRDSTHTYELGASEVEQFLTHLAINGKCAASTQKQAKSTLLFLYKEVLNLGLPWLGHVEQAKTPKHLPVVLNRAEIQAIISRLQCTHWLVASLLYGTGMRIMECLCLRVQDVDFKRREILIRDSKGFKDRVTSVATDVSGSLTKSFDQGKSLASSRFGRKPQRCLYATSFSAQLSGGGKGVDLAVRISCRQFIA